MGLKKTISEKNGKAYYFENGRRVSNVYYLSHWGPKGRIKNTDFESYWSRVPEGVNLEESRAMQNAYLSERSINEEMERAKSENLDVSKQTPHFNITQLMDLALADGKRIFVDGIEFSQEDAFEYALTRMQEIEAERNKINKAYAWVTTIDTKRALMFFTDKVDFL